MLNVTVFEAAMGPMIGASIVAMDHELDPPLLTLMVGVGIPLSFLTLPRVVAFAEFPLTPVERGRDPDGFHRTALPDAVGLARALARLPERTSTRSLFGLDGFREPRFDVVGHCFSPERCLAGRFPCEQVHMPGPWRR